MKFVQLIDYKKENVFLQKYSKRSREASSRPLFVSLKSFYKVKASGLQLSFNIFRYPSIWHAIKANCIKLELTNPEICSVFIFKKRFNNSSSVIFCV